MNTIHERCFEKALRLVESGAITLTSEMNVFDFTDLLIKLEQEKLDKEIKSDIVIDYNDEIISIEDIGIKDTVDISVSGDNLFYCNRILTKNSFGLPATADFMFALIATEKLDEMNQIMVKQLKNRYNDAIVNRKFIIGINRSKMKLYDIANQPQLAGSNNEPEEEQEEIRFTSKFGKKNFSKWQQ